MNINSIIAEINDACDGWITANWTHECGADRNGEPLYCEGGNPEICGRCEEAESDARIAAMHGRSAIAALQQGDIDRALDELEKASLLENNYGDDPCWGVPRKALDCAIARHKSSQKAIVQISTAILGLGDTCEDALADAQTAFPDLTAADIITPARRGIAGECVCVDISDELAECPATDNWDLETDEMGDLVAVSTR